MHVCEVDSPAGWRSRLLPRASARAWPTHLLEAVEVAELSTTAACRMRDYAQVRTAALHEARIPKQNRQKRTMA